LDVLLYKNPDFEGFEGSGGSELMLGWIVLLMGVNEILLLFVCMDASNVKPQGIPDELTQVNCNTWYKILFLKPLA
jgi:hypothetical protein